MNNLQAGLIAAATICCSERGYIWTEEVIWDVQVLAVQLASWLDGQEGDARE